MYVKLISNFGLIQSGESWLWWKTSTKLIQYVEQSGSFLCKKTFVLKLSLDLLHRWRTRYIVNFHSNSLIVSYLNVYIFDAKNKCVLWKTLFFSFIDVKVASNLNKFRGFKRFQHYTSDLTFYFCLSFVLRL